MPVKLLAGSGGEDPIEVMLQETLFKVETSPTFEKKQQALITLEYDLFKLDESDQLSEHYDYQELVAALAHAELNTLDSESCLQALDRLEKGGSSVSETDMSPPYGMYRVVYDIVHHLCFFDSDDFS